MTTLAIGVMLASLLPAPAAMKTKVDAIVTKHLQALGGAPRLRAVRSLRHTGIMTMVIGERTLEGPLVLEMKRPNKTRMEAVLNGARMVEWFDGTSGWTLVPGGSMPSPMPPARLADQEVEAEFDNWLLDYKSRGVTVEYLGEAQVGQTAALKLKVVLKGKSVYRYLDARSYLEIKRETLGPGGEPVSEVLTDGYATVDGLKMPVSMALTYKGKPFRTWLRFDKTDVNPDIPDATFGPPR